MKTRLLSLTIILCLFMSVVIPFNVFGAINGTSGDNITWTLDDAGTLTISGEGKVPSNAPWHIHRINIKNIIIEEGITSIGSNAFSSYYNVQSVTLPDSLTKIGNYAFDSCESLSNINIPDSVTEIGEYAFAYCYELTEIDIPDGVTAIEEGAFEYCEKLSNVTFGNGLTTIGDYAFDFCFNLTSITLPNSVTEMGYGVFYHCEKLENINIPENVTYIGVDAFSYCESLTSIDVDENNSYYSSIDGNLYNKDQTELITYTAGKEDTLFSVPEGVESILGSAFIGSNNLTNIKVSGSVSSIGSYTFSYCPNLVNIIVDENNLDFSSLDGNLYNKNQTTLMACPPGKSDSFIIIDSVNKIDRYAFNGCVNLTNINITANISTIYSDTFSDCEKLTSLTVDENNMLYASINGNLFNKEQTEILACPPGKSGNFIIPNTITKIGDYAFVNCAGLTAISIPNSVITMGKYAFRNCTGLSEVAIPYSVTAISDYAFYYCGSLVNVDIAEGVKEIGKNAFFSCRKLTDINIPDSITKIGDYAFRRCDSLTSIHLPDSITKLGRSAFNRCTELKSITIPAGVTEITASAFDNCESLTNVIMHNNITTIGDSAFYGCESLTTIDIPESVTEIGSSAFDSCYSLTNINIPNGVEEILDWTFADCYELESIIIPDSVCFIDQYAFSGCENLESVTIPNSVTDIESYAFHWCDALSDVYYNGTEEEWNEIYIGSNNECLTNATIHFNGSGNGEDVTPIPVEGVFLDYINNSMYVGDTITLNATVYPENATNKNIFWYSNNETVAKVENGVVTAVGEGNAIIYVITEDGHFEDFCIVNVPYENIYESLSYEIIDNRVIIIDCDQNAKGELIIPSVFNGYTVVAIGDSAFRNCTLLSSVTIPSSVTTIADYAFMQCTNLETVHISSGTTHIGRQAFFMCSNLKNINIPSSVTSIDINAFVNCSSLTEIVIPNNITTIGESMFYGCTNLSSITIPDSVTNINIGAFYNCSSLTDVYYLGSENEWNNILIDDHNEYLAGATVHYNYSPAAVSAISDYAKNGNTVNFNLNLKGPDDVADTVIAAVYDESGVMKTIKALPAKGLTNVSIDATDGSYIKALWWNTENVKPYTNSIQLDVK